jgi:small-conductance mechanosensitive channel
LHELRASSAFTCFSNTLVVSLFSLMPAHNAGSVLISVSIVGLLAMTRSLLRLLRLEREHQRANRGDGGFVVVQTLWFIGQLIVGALLNFGHGDRTDLYEWMAILVVVFFLTGIGRSWQLIGGPELSLREEAVKLRESERKRDAR